ncbi:MAG: DHA2 family efflux MFS transporter permease subunit [Proteobacteria bacterium]|nr:DHA2 family efflux MFS transporter permease subunit [Pseudomonadota bacterium]
MEQTLITGSKRGITIAAMSAALMAILDISIVNVAISDIRASFGTPIDQIAWVSTGYMMANVVIIPMTGFLQRRFGFRKYFTFSIGLFLIASMLCGLAWNLPSLVAFRILQGMGGGAIIPTSQSILFARYPRQEHGMAGALFGLGAITGPLLGPTLGGYLIDIASWHWIFYINLPIGAFAMYMAWKHIEEPSFQANHTPIDRWGLSLLAIGMASLQYVLEEGNRDDWFQSSTIIILSAVALVSLITFAVHELEIESPIVDLRVFANRSYAAATGINFMIGIALFSATFLFALYCGAIMHYKALDIGLLFLKGSCIQIFIMPLIGRFGHKADGRVLLAFGISMLIAGLYMNTRLTNQSNFNQLVLPIFIRSLGLGFVFVPLSLIALSDLPAHQRGNAAGLFNLTRELGGSIGTAWMSTVLSRSQTREYAYISESITNYSEATRQRLELMQHGIGQKLADPNGILALLRLKISEQSLIKAFNSSFLLIAIAFTATLLLVFLLRRPSQGGAPSHDAH